MRSHKMITSGSFECMEVDDLYFWQRLFTSLSQSHVCEYFKTVHYIYIYLQMCFHFSLKRFANETRENITWKGGGAMLFMSDIMYILGVLLQSSSFRGITATLPWLAGRLVLPWGKNRGCASERLEIEARRRWFIKLVLWSRERLSGWWVFGCRKEDWVKMGFTKLFVVYISYVALIFLGNFLAWG